VSTGRAPRGLSVARNVSIANAAPRATHLVTLDADVVLDPRAIGRMQLASKRYPLAAAFGAVHWLPPGAREAVEETLRRGRVDRLRELVPDGVASRVEGTIVGMDPRPRALFVSADRVSPTPLDPALALNTFSAIPLSALRAAGGWDEALVGYGYEDMELGARLLRHSTAALHVGDAVGFHVWHAKAGWSREALEAERNLDYVLRRLGVDAVSDTFADWTVWWHYHHDRGGALWAIDGCHYAVNRDRSRAIVLPSPDWTDKLGYPHNRARPAKPEELARIELMGEARDLPLSRVPHVEPLG
jgi:GT2 family glycosyltransferase